MRTLYVVIVILGVLGYCFCIHIPDELKVLNDTLESTPEEIQHAMCKVATEEIQATANATITRQLKGVCSRKEMNARLERMEKTILNELFAIKEMMQLYGMPFVKSSNNYENQIDEFDYNYDEEEATLHKAQDGATQHEAIQHEAIQHGAVQHGAIQQHGTVQHGAVQHEATQHEAIQHGAIQHGAVQHEATEYDALQHEATQYGTTQYEATQYEATQYEATQYEATQYPQVLVQKEIKSGGTSDLEIIQYNTTTQTIRGLGRVLYYYWLIEKSMETIQNVSPILSPVFEVEGHSVQIEFNPQYFGVNLDVVSKGGFYKKYRFTVMDQSDNTKDITSQMLSALPNYDRIYTVSHGKILGFILEDTILIKLIVYLDK